MSELKFKPFQRVTIPDFMINGSRMDVNGMVEEYDRRSQKYVVIINTVRVLLAEERIRDYEEFWDAKNREGK